LVLLQEIGFTSCFIQILLTDDCWTSTNFTLFVCTVSYSS